MFSIHEIRRSLDQQIAKIGIDSPSRSLLEHLDEIERLVRGAREAVASGDGGALHDVRDVAVAACQAMAQHGAPVTRRPERKTAK